MACARCVHAIHVAEFRCSQSIAVGLEVGHRITRRTTRPVDRAFYVSNLFISLLC